MVPWKGGEERKHGFVWLWEKKRVTQQVPRVHVDQATGLVRWACSFTVGSAACGPWADVGPTPSL